MNIGKLRHRVTIQERTVEKDDVGQAIETWDTFDTVWASVEPLRGREYFAAAQANAQVTHKVTIRYLDGVLPTMRVLFGSRVLTIDAILNTEERNREMVLMCEEEVDG